MQNPTKRDVLKILPDRDIDDNVPQQQVQKEVLTTVISDNIRKSNSREIALIKLREKRANELDKIHSEKQYATAELIRNADLTKPIIALPAGQKTMAGITRPEIQRLLNSLNINLNINLTKGDTYNLLATLLTCNEAQLRAIESNKKVPIVIKIIIKRLLADYTTGATGTIEMLWNRIFGSGNMSLTLPTDVQSAGLNGLLPNKPISREAYMIIRETIIGRDDIEQQ